VKTDRVRVARVLAQGLREVAEEVDASSIHVLFCRRSSNFRDPLADNSLLWR
jgi:predicted N-acyltransferase